MSSGEFPSPDLQTLLEQDPARVQALLEEVHPQDIADIVENLRSSEAGILMGHLPTEYAAQVFERLDEETQQELTATLGVEKTAELAMEMDPDDRADFFSVLPSALGVGILHHIEAEDPEAAQDLAELSQWPNTSAGGLMTTNFVSVAPDRTVREAIERMREVADHMETLDTLYVITGTDVLVGVLPLKSVLLADPTSLVIDVMFSHFKSVLPDLDQEDVARKLAKYDLSTLPVVNEQGELLGVITADDVLDVLTEEQSEDVHKMGAMQPLQNGYLDTGYWPFLSKRAPWLLVLFLGGFLTTQTMQAFELELSMVTQLSFYLPLLVSAGGNSGSQSSTLIIRALATGDVTAGDWYKVFNKEALQGLTLGVMLALLGVGRALIAGDGLTFALLVGTTIVCIVLMGCVIGAMTPLLLHRLRLDPATSSTPFIASVVDVAGIVVYLMLARLLLSNLLPAPAH
jgi:magnesium transporter